MTRETIDNELIDNLLKNYKKPEDLVGETATEPLRRHARRMA